RQGGRLSDGDERTPEHRVGDAGGAHQVDERGVAAEQHATAGGADGGGEPHPLQLVAVALDELQGDRRAVERLAAPGARAGERGAYRRARASVAGEQLGRRGCVAPGDLAPGGERVTDGERLVVEGGTVGRGVVVAAQQLAD